MTSTLLSMDEVARRLGGGTPIALSTLYGILKRIEVNNPGVVFSRKVGRLRMFTEHDYEFIVEQLAWRPSASRRELDEQSEFLVQQSVDRAMNLLRRRETRKLMQAVRDNLGNKPKHR